MHSTNEWKLKCKNKKKDSCFGWAMLLCPSLEPAQCQVERIVQAHSFYRRKREMNGGSNPVSLTPETLPRKSTAGSPQRNARNNDIARALQGSGINKERRQKSQWPACRPWWWYLCVVPAIAPNCKSPKTSESTHKTKQVTFRSIVGSTTLLDSLDGWSTCLVSEPIPTTLWIRQMPTLTHFKEV